MDPHHSRNNCNGNRSNSSSNFRGTPDNSYDSNSQPNSPIPPLPWHFPHTIYDDHPRTPEGPPPSRQRNPTVTQRPRPSDGTGNTPLMQNLPANTRDYRVSTPPSNQTHPNSSGSRRSSRSSNIQPPNQHDNTTRNGNGGHTVSHPRQSSQRRSGSSSQRDRGIENIENIPPGRSDHDYYHTSRRRSNRRPRSPSFW